MNIQPKKKKKTLYMNFGESEKDKDWVQETDLHVPPYHVIYYCQRCVSEKIATHHIWGNNYMPKILSKIR